MTNVRRAIIQITLTGAAAMLIASSPASLYGESKTNVDDNIAWQEDFNKPFEPATTFGIEQTWAGDKVLLADIERKTGMARVTFDVPLRGPAYRYLQIDLKAFDRNGYHRFAVRLDGEGGEVGGGRVTGLYTFDLMAAYPKLRQSDNANLVLFVLGGRADTDPPQAGVRFEFDSMKLVKKPEEGVAVKLLDAGDVVKAGSKIEFTAWTPPGTKDVTVECANWIGKAIALTSDPYIQLKPANDEKSLWRATVTIGNKLLPPDESDYGKAARMGVIFVTATVVGGNHERLYTSVGYPVQWSEK